MFVFALYIAKQLTAAELTVCIAIFILKICPVTVSVLTVALICASLGKSSSAACHVESGAQQLTVVTAAVVIKVKLFFRHKHRVALAKKGFTVICGIQAAETQPIVSGAINAALWRRFGGLHCHSRQCADCHDGGKRQTK